MNLIMYGMNICPDCVEALETLKKHPEITVDYRDFTKETINLKEFLKFRDSQEIFAKIKEDGGIGIPLFVKEDGSLTLHLEEIIQNLSKN